MELRPYQTSGVQGLRHGLGNGMKRQILYSPTGSGKTEMGMALIHGAIAKRKRVAFLANRIHLVSQTSRRFDAASIQHGIIQGANTSRPDADVVVASIQTVAKRGLPGFDLIVIDEAHGVAGSKAFRDILLSATCPVVGLSATPWSKGLGKFYEELNGPLFEQIVVAATIPQLIDQGYLVDCDVYAPSTPDMSEVKQQRNAFGEMDYVESALAKAVDKPQLVGDIVRHWLRLANGTATVCFASNIAHSKHIVAQFQAKGVAAEHIDCYTEDTEREAILRRVTTGETLVISNVGILAEGWDFPACRTLILARPTKSLIRYIQMVGRVLRPFDGKDRALVLDHSGTVTSLGFPTDPIPLELDDGIPKDAKPVSDEEREPSETLPKVCPSCSYVKPASVFVCPVCNFEPVAPNTIKTAEGELVKVEKAKPKLEKQDFYSQLWDVAERKGHKSGWVAHKYREYFGVWPRKVNDVPKPVTPEVLKFLTHLNIKSARSKHAGN